MSWSVGPCSASQAALHRRSGSCPGLSLSVEPVARHWSSIGFVGSLGAATCADAFPPTFGALDFAASPAHTEHRVSGAWRSTAIDQRKSMEAPYQPHWTEHPSTTSGLADDMAILRKELQILKGDHLYKFDAVHARLASLAENDAYDTMLRRLEDLEGRLVDGGPRAGGGVREEVVVVSMRIQELQLRLAAEVGVVAEVRAELDRRLSCLERQSSAVGQQRVGVVENRVVDLAERLSKVARDSESLQRAVHDIWERQRDFQTLALEENKARDAHYTSFEQRLARLEGGDVGVFSDTRRSSEERRLQVMERSLSKAAERQAHELETVRRTWQDLQSRTNAWTAEKERYVTFERFALLEKRMESCQTRANDLEVGLRSWPPALLDERYAALAELVERLGARAGTLAGASGASLELEERHAALAERVERLWVLVCPSAVEGQALALEVSHKKLLELQGDVNTVRTQQQELVTVGRHALLEQSVDKRATLVHLETEINARKAAARSVEEQLAAALQRVSTLHSELARRVEVTQEAVDASSSQYCLSLATLERELRGACVRVREESEVRRQDHMAILQRVEFMEERVCSWAGNMVAKQLRDASFVAQDQAALLARLNAGALRAAAPASPSAPASPVATAPCSPPHRTRSPPREKLPAGGSGAAVASSTLAEAGARAAVAF